MLFKPHLERLEDRLMPSALLPAGFPAELADAGPPGLVGYVESGLQAFAHNSGHATEAARWAVAAEHWGWSPAVAQDAAIVLSSAVDALSHLQPGDGPQATAIIRSTFDGLGSV
jgi:hypothetical protein